MTDTIVVNTTEQLDLTTALVKMLDEAEVDEDALSETVLDLWSKEACDVNNGGFEKQIEFLIEDAGIDFAIQQVADLCHAQKKDVEVWLRACGAIETGDIEDVFKIDNVHSLVAALSVNNVSKASLTPLVLEVAGASDKEPSAHTVLSGDLQDICAYLIQRLGVEQIVERLKKLLVPSGPRAKTRDEMRAEFQEHALAMAKYWARLDSGVMCREGETEAEYRCSGVVFSLMVMLDGGAAVGPYHVIPCASEENVQYAKDEGLANYVPADHGPDITDRLQAVDLAGGLHDTLQHADKERYEKIAKMMEVAGELMKLDIEMDDLDEKLAEVSKKFRAARGEETT
jgi:hypothetical protein